MMLDLESERYARTGSIAAEGIQRLLGTPTSDRLETTLRESVQNSWDARLPGHTPRFSIRLRDLTPAQRDKLRSEVFAWRLPREAPHADQLRRFLDGDALRVLELADFHTRGLGGPTSPEAVPDPDERTDFVDFLRNIGSPRNTHLGGGTYGYGKSSFYALSVCHTVIADTVCRHNGGYERRLMACHIGERFDLTEHARQQRYTGRHWWGKSRTDGFLDPVTGSAAEALAANLGLPARGPEDTGTTVVVLGPMIPGEIEQNEQTDELPDEDGDVRVSGSPGERMRGIILASFWPKLVRHADGSQPMLFSICTDGRDWPVPDPDDTPPFHLYADALRKVREQTEGSHEIRSHRPKRLLGRIAVRRDLVLPGAVVPRRGRAPFAAPARHVALMRTAELVVKYLPGEQLPDDRAEWAGVFVSDSDPAIDNAFAASEPPAHDDWIPNNLESRSHSKTFVNVALRRIREHTARMVSAETQPNAGTEGGSLGRLADRLGGSLLAVPGSRLGGGNRRGRGGGGGGGGRRRAVATGFLQLEEIDGQPHARFAVQLPQSQDARRLFRGEAEVLLEERQGIGMAPNGKEPRVVRWEDNAGNLLAAGDSMETGQEPSEAHVLVLIPDYVAVRLRINEISSETDNG